MPTSIMKVCLGWFVVACCGTASAVTIPFADHTDLRAALVQAHRSATPLYAAQSIYTVSATSPWTENKVVADDAQPGDSLGFSSAIEGNTAMVGAPQGKSSASGTDNGGPGAVYVYTNVGGTWTQTQKLVADDGADNDQFGTSVAFQGDTAVIGAATANSSQGVAYVFTLNAGVWTQAAKIVADDGASGDLFGQSVGVDGSTVVVGAPIAAPGGAVYVFDDNGGTWSQTAKLSDSLQPLHASIGYSVAIHGTTVIAGAPNATEGSNSFQGAAYRFDNTGGTWSQTQRVVASDGASGDSFGVTVATDGTHVMVGAPFAAVGASSFQGAVYDFQPVDGVLTQTQKVSADDGQFFDVFGICLGIDAGNIIVGAPFALGSQGKAYLFSYDADNGWLQQQIFTASDAIQGEGSGLGFSCGITNQTPILGAAAESAAFDPNAPTYEGAAYIYNYDRVFSDGFDSN